MVYRRIYHGLEFRCEIIISRGRRSRKIIDYFDSTTTFYWHYFITNYFPMSIDTKTRMLLTSHACCLRHFGCWIHRLSVQKYKHLFDPKRYTMYKSVYIMLWSKQTPNCMCQNDVIKTDVYDWRHVTFIHNNALLYEGVKCNSKSRIHFGVMRPWVCCTIYHDLVCSLSIQNVLRIVVEY